MFVRERMRAPAGRKKSSGTALYRFLRIAELWGLSDRDQEKLLGVTKPALSQWRKCPDTALPADTLERISCIVGIYTALHILLPDREIANNWVKGSKVPLFGNQSALHQMQLGKVEDLSAVKQYLDAQLGG